MIESGFSRRRILALLGAASVSAASGSMFGCSRGSSQEATLSPTAGNPQPVPTSAIVSAFVRVSASVIAPVSNQSCGLSYEKDALWRRTLSTANTGLVALFRLLNGAGSLRVGGNTVDQCNYFAAGTGQVQNQIAPSDIDAFAAFVKATNSTVIYGINLKGAAQMPPTQSATLAVAEANYVAKALGDNLKYFEIGNEPDLYTTASGSAYTYSQFQTLWQPIAAAVHAAQPNVSLSGPTLGLEANIPGWTVPFARMAPGYGASLLTQHRYVGDAATSSSNDVKLLLDSSNTYPPQQMQIIANAASSSNTAWRMAETGTYTDSAAGPQAKDFASALWGIDYLFEVLTNGAIGLNFHGGHNFAFAPLNDNSGTTVTSVNALFYGALLFTLAGAGHAVQTSINSAVNAGAHAVQVDSKHFNVLITNKDATSSQSMQVTTTLPGTVASASLKLLTASALNAQTGVTLQGGTVGVDGSFSPNADYTLVASGSAVTCYVPYNSAVLIQCVLL